MDGGNSSVDVVVIGAGVNGSGVARDCALRGMRVALFERNDIAFGASGNSSGMIHGGPRYLTQDPEVTFRSCQDSGYIQKIAPHLLFRIPVLMPVERGGIAGKIELLALDGFFEAYDRFQPLKRGKPHLRFTADELQAAEPGLLGVGAGGISFDEWGIDGNRLCVANVVDAIERGATASVHTSVTDIERDENGAVRGVKFRDELSHEEGRLDCRVVVNATGAWAPITAGLSKLKPEVARVRPGKGSHVVLDRRVSNYAILTKAVDGRSIFLLPWQNVSILGTTDDDFYGDLDHVTANSDEVRYLFEAVARVFPGIRQARAIGTTAGVRPTLYEWGKHEDALSREHEIVDHGPHGAPGMYSMLGGKLASYRWFAEEMSDVVAERLSNHTACRTHSMPLPGGEEVIDPKEFAVSTGISGLAAVRMIYRHGGRSRQLAARMASDPEQKRVLCDCEPVLEAEVRHVVRGELARTVEDVSRRTRLGLGACGGMRCAASCGAVLADELGQSPSWGRDSARQFLVSAGRRRLPALNPAQARQEAMLSASVLTSLGSGEDAQ